MKKYSINNPFLAKIRKRYRLNAPASSKKTYFIALDISGSQIEYSPGDSIAVLPMNDPKIVDDLIVLCKVSPSTEIMHPRLNKKISLRDFFLYKANISKLTQPLLQYIHENQPNDEKRKHIKTLLLAENKEQMAEYLHARQLLDLLQENQEADIHYEELIKKLPALIPRFYSISSSQRVSPDEIHLIVVLVEFETNHIKRTGVATNFLCKLAEENTTSIPLFVHANTSFHLPHSSNDIIMIGPGCGVAPFISFLQDRKKSNASGKNWLFFGEQRRKYDFYFQDLLLQMEKEEFLKLSLAFSRDQQNKIYVQHKMLDHAEEFIQWIENGAHLYICGDAKRMAKDIDCTLEKILMEQKQIKAEEAKEYLQKMQKEKRYRKDVY